MSIRICFCHKHPSLEMTNLFCIPRTISFPFYQISDGIARISSVLWSSCHHIISFAKRSHCDQKQAYVKVIHWELQRHSWIVVPQFDKTEPSNGIRLLDEFSLHEIMLQSDLFCKGTLRFGSGWHFLS